MFLSRKELVMRDELLIRHCAPTLAGIKTGSLFVCPYEDKREVLDAVRTTNGRLSKKGLRTVPLRFSDKKALLYVYRPRHLCADLADKDAASLLKNCGYDVKNCQNCILRLAQKLRSQRDFPHEIGLFLGYPPEDVRGFMVNHACGSKCAGCWKVYGDVAAAQKKFALYKKCARVYRERWEKGSTIDKLTVIS